MEVLPDLINYTLPHLQREKIEIFRFLPDRPFWSSRWFDGWTRTLITPHALQEEAKKIRKVLIILDIISSNNFYVNIGLEICRHIFCKVV